MTRFGGVAAFVGAALFFAAEGVANATRPCPPGTHSSHTIPVVVAAFGISMTIGVAAVGVAAIRASKGWRRVLAVVVTLLGIAMCAWMGVVITLIAGVMLSGCVND
jgi:hypothetical protein